jgi:hypothetical protein
MDKEEKNERSDKENKEIVSRCGLEYSGSR